MLFMVIERFAGCGPVPLYRRLRDTGRSLPAGLTDVGIWIEPNFDRCFQLIDCDDARLLQEWVLSWRGSGGSFEMVPVVPSDQIRAVAAPHLDGPAP